MKNFEIEVKDDDIVEGMENHYINFKVSVGETRVNFQPENVTVTVSDDSDSKCVCVFVCVCE